MLIILLATIYLLTIYLLISVVQKQAKVGTTPTREVGQASSVR